MKLKLNQIKPNPFKKNINGGKLDEDNIIKIQSNLKELGLMGSLPVFKKDDKYFLIAGHHRVEALKRTFGKDYELSVDVKQYSEDNILRGMVIENLTQRDNEHVEERANIAAIRDYLNNHKDVLETIRSARVVRDKEMKHNPEYKDKSCASDISFWIDKGNGDVISHDKVTNLININDNLSSDLLGLVEKNKNKHKDEKTITVMEAVELAKIKDPKEQKEVLKAIKEVDAGRPYQMVSKYRKAPEEVKEQIKKGAIKLDDIDMAVTQYNLREKKKGRITIQDISKKIDGLIDLVSFSIADTERNLKGLIKDLANVSRYVQDMEEKQKARLGKKINDFADLLSKASNLMKEVDKRI